MLDQSILEHYHLEPNSIQQLAGGDINEVYLIEIDNELSVIKVNDREAYPEMFAAEGKGLNLLRESESFCIPAVRGTFDLNKYQILELEYLQSGNPSNQFSLIFAQQLVKQHQFSADFFGNDHDNYIGSLPQSNRKHTSWTEFFVTERLFPQLKLAVDQGLIDRIERKQVEAFARFVPELWPKEAPALLHGDLWSGNYMTLADGSPALIDPAVYFGHREIDLGMMELFGGFDPAILDNYHQLYPLEKGWKTRISYNQIYPLFVHLNLFGRSYWGQIQSILREFS